MKKQIYITIGIIIAIIIALYYFLGAENTSLETIEVQVKSGEFKIAVTTTGELEAKSSEKIYGPSNLRNVRIWQVKIEDIVPDGTVVEQCIDHTLKFGSKIRNLIRTADPGLKNMFQVAN